MDAVVSQRRKALRGSVAAVIEQLEARTLLSATVPAGFVKLNSAPIEVTALNSVPTDTHIAMHSGVQYYIVASGTHRLGISPTRLADPQFYQRTQDLQWVKGSGPHLHVTGVSGWASTYAEADNHTYGKQITGTNAEMMAYISDDEYGDNLGGLELDVYAALPAVTVTAGPNPAKEAGQVSQNFTFNRTGSTTAALTVEYALGGSATIGDDYTVSGDATTNPTSLNREIVFAIGSSTATVTVTPKTDAIPNENESVLASVQGPATNATVFYAPVAPAASIAIQDLPTVELTKVQDGSEEGSAPGKFTVSRTGPTDQTLNVQLRYYAQGGWDWSDGSIPANSITFAIGESSRTIPMQVTDDHVVDPGEGLLAVLAPTANYQIAGSPVLMNIIDNDGTTVPPNTPIPPTGGGSLPTNGPDEWVDVELNESYLFYGYQGQTGQRWFGSTSDSLTSDPGGDGLTTGQYVQYNAVSDPSTVPWAADVTPFTVFKSSTVDDAQGSTTLTWDSSKFNVWKQIATSSSSDQPTYEKQQSGWTIANGDLQSPSWSWPGIGGLIEPIKPSDHLDDASLTAQFTPDAPHATAVKDTAKFTIAGVDLDVDSDNNNVDGVPDRDNAEEKLEDDQTVPGRILHQWQDLDDDGVPDFADGFDLQSGVGETTDDVISNPSGGGNVFAQMDLEIPGAVDITKATVTFTYAGSDPAVVTRTGDWSQGQNHVYTLPDTNNNLRIWTKPSNVTRNPKSVMQGGDYIAPGSAIDFSKLSTGERLVKLWVEAIRPSATPGDSPIEVQLDATGNGAIVSKDVVRFTTWTETAPVVTATPAPGGASITLNWTHPFSEKGYNIYQLQPNGWAKIGSTDYKTKTFTVNGTALDLGYSYRVVAANSASSSLDWRSEYLSDSLPCRVFNGPATSKRATAFSLLQSAEVISKGTLYYMAGNNIAYGTVVPGTPPIEGFYDQAFLTLNNIKVDLNNTWTTKSDPQAQYDKSTDTMTIRAIGAYNYDLVHEMIHAIDDANGWYSDYENAEALAYAGEYIIEAADASFLNFMPSRSGTFSATQMQSSWNTAWRSISNLPAHTVTYFSILNPFDGDLTNDFRPMTSADVTDAETKLGLQLSSSTLLPIYNSWLKHHGYAPNLLSNTFAGFTIDPAFQ